MGLFNEFIAQAKKQPLTLVNAGYYFRRLRGRGANLI